MLKAYFGLGTRVSGKRIFASWLAVSLLLNAATTGHAESEDEDFRPKVSIDQYAADLITPPVLTVTSEVYHDTLPSLANTPGLPFYGPVGLHFEGLIPLPPGSENQIDGAVQPPGHGPLAPTPPLISSVLGIGNSGPAGSASSGSNWITGTPPDTNGAVGSTQYVQTVNGSLVVFDKATKTVVFGPEYNNTLWSGISAGQCGTRNDGDPVVAYDKAADRWVITQFSVPNNNGPDWQCIAVSQTNDATGAWNRYVFQYAGFNDYGKLGVWSDAYYMTFNMFGAESGAKLCAFDRTAMLAGNTATQQCFQLASSLGGVLPADIDGSTPPPAGSPSYMLNFGTNSLNLWKFHVDWANPNNTTLNGSNSDVSGLFAPVVIPVAAFAPACSGNACIPQKAPPKPAKAATLDSLADRLMFRLAYRNFGDHESLVVSHSVTAGAGSAVRWYEIRSPGSATPVVYQQATFSPDSTLYRWMPSVAMDHDGNMALGYSTSSSTTFPSIAYTGRLATDTLSTMGSEVQMATGTGAETYNRWGDYSAMTIDPVDDCTFWYTTEYVLTTGEFTWDTRIGSFKFPSCGGGTYTIGGNVGGQTSGFTLSLNSGAQTKSILVSDTSYTFPTGLANGASYSVAVQTQPSGQTCTVANGSGTIGSSNVTNANVTCKTNQTITYTSSAPAAAVVGGTAYNVTATGGASGNPVTFTIDASANGICSISGSSVSFTGVGTCIIDANQAGNASYNDAPQAQQSFAVGKGSQAITYTSTVPAGAVVGGASYNVTATGGASGNPVTFTIDATASGICAISGSTVSFTAAGTCKIDADQAGNASYDAAPQAQQSFAVGKGSQAVTYTSTAPSAAVVGGATYNVAATGGASGNPVTFTTATSSVCTISGSTVSFLTAGTCTIDADQAGDANYEAAPQMQQSFAVGKGSQAITFTSTAPSAAVVGGATYNVAATGGASGNPVTFTIDATASGICAISGSTVSFTAAGTCKIDADQAGDANYNAAPQAQQTFAVGLQSQTITFPVISSFVWLGGSSNLAATASSGLAVTYSVVSGPCQATGGTVTASHAGSCSIAADQAGNGSYAATPTVTKTVTVDKAPQVISFGAMADGAVGTMRSLSATGGGSGNAVTFSTLSTSVCSIAGSTVSFVAVGSCAISADQAGNADYLAATTVIQPVTVDKGDQAITYTSTVPASAVVGGATYDVAATGGASGNPVTFTIDATASSVCTISGTTVSFTGVGNCVINADQAGDTNYNAAAQTQQSFAVGIGSQSIAFSAPPASASVDGATYGVTATSSAGLTPVSLVIDPSASTFCSLSTGTSPATVSFTGAGTCKINASQAGNSNYNSAAATQSFAVGKGNQTINITNPAPASASAGGAYTPAATGGASGNPVTFSIDATSTSGACSISGGTVSFLAAGSCKIDADQAGNTNYNAAPQVQQSVAIGLQSQTIAFNPASPVAYSAGGQITLSATASSGLTVSFASNSTGICTVSSSTVTIVTAGDCSITASQAGDATTYAAATPVTRSITISKASQTITFPNPGPVTYSAGGSFSLSGTASSGLTVSYTSATSGVCTVSGGIVAIVTAGTCTIKADQAGGTNYNAAPQVSDDITISKANQTITFTSVSPGSAVVGGATYNVGATGGASGNTVTFTVEATAAGVCSVSGSTVSFMGAGTCVIDANQAGNTNYTAATQKQQSFTVGKADQTITYTSIAPAGAVVAGATYNVTATGGASGNAVTFTIEATAAGVCSISGSTVSFTGAGTCVIDADQTGNANYNAATQKQQSFMVGKGNQTISFTSTAPASTKVAGATYSVSAVATSGLPVALTIDGSASSVCSISGSAVSFTGVGTCVIDANQTGGANYNAAVQKQQSFAVGPGVPTLVFTEQPANVNQGDALGTIQVTEQDAQGNVIADNATVSFTIPACGGTVTLGSVQMTNGVATLLSTQRFYTLTAGLQVAASTSSLNATSAAFNVAAGSVLFSNGFEGCRL